MIVLSVTSSSSSFGSIWCSLSSIGMSTASAVSRNERAREVDRDAELVALALPGLDLAHGGAEHPAGERDDQAGLLGDRDELLGSEQPVARVVPAHERLDADDAAGHDVGLGLVVQLELSFSSAERSSPASERRRGE